MSSPTTRTLGQLVRFGLAGLVNTAVGLGVTLLLDPVLGAPPWLANAVGYAVGVIVSFVLSRTFVFRSNGALPATGLRYAVAVAAAFALNQGVLFVAGRALGPGSIQHVVAQLLAMGSYSTALFLLCRFWVFPARAGAAAE